ncbi:sucrose-phosphate phosphatase [Fischerella sp. PCC 9605]|uniref:sucrose-phosphate phosphatase n=1 Tax=Fischerella sp. PCC 9605 TaxID=1173024 RepID=UPI00047CF0DB|nr:sucrose-phosphate phosphatase [Fischerella sp. PCC 9605]
MKLLIVIDLDNTLVENNQANAALNQRLEAIHNQIYLVYVTSHSYASSHKLIAQAKLLKPDFLITSVGSEIYQQGAFLEQDWANYISKDWNRDRVWSVASEFSELKLQPESEQTPWKLSFWLDMAASLDVINDVRNLLKFAGLSAQVIFSNGRDVDIVPQSSNKGNATVYLQQLLQVQPNATIICGGSGNDISLFQLSSPGIIVGNAQTELLWWYYNTRYPRHYLTHYPYAVGILEGFIYFDVLPFSQYRY